MAEVIFEWDPNKDRTNQKKHGLSFEEAQEVFADQYAILFDDPEHSDDEDRFIIIGSSKSARVCVVVHCYRQRENAECVRIISARRANKLEQWTYFKGGN